MAWGEALFLAGEFALREAALFAAVGFLVLGVGDLAIDFIWIVRVFRISAARRPRACSASLESPAAPGRFAIFVPAWDESAVIGPMLRHALAAYGERDHRLYVGCYPNDPATVAAVAEAAGDRARIVVGDSPGPTTKADCLNNIYWAMLADEAAEGRAFKGVVLHDAEDVVHSAELRLFDSLIERFDLVQLPVLPLIDPKSRWIGGHYADEFAEAHAKELVVREALGAGLPSAGVGCAISRRALALLAEEQGAPFDPASVTEDYELGLRLEALGLRAAFVRLPAGADRPLVATRAYFPGSLSAAVNQKARWMRGIALSGWDRLGWRGGLAERWMRLRDRQSLLAALILLAGYLALVLAPVLALAGLAAGRPPAPLGPLLETLLLATLLLLLWRLAMRFGFVAAAYGWREGLCSIPRVLVGNAIAMLAARKAIIGYIDARRSGRADWGKTAHVFPVQLPAE